MGHAGEYAVEVAQWIADVQAMAVDAQLTDRALVLAGALFQYGDRLAHLAARLEVAQQHHRVGEIADVDRTLHVPDQALLRVDHQGDHAELAEVGEQLVQLDQHEMFFRHRVDVTIEAVDDDGARAGFLDGIADALYELARR